MVKAVKHRDLHIQAHKHTWKLMALGFDGIENNIGVTSRALANSLSKKALNLRTSFFDSKVGQLFFYDPTKDWWFFSLEGET